MNQTKTGIIQYKKYFRQIKFLKKIVLSPKIKPKNETNKLKPMIKLSLIPKSAKQCKKESERTIQIPIETRDLLILLINKLNPDK